PYGHPLAPPASTASPPLRRSPPCRPGEPGLAPPARRLRSEERRAGNTQERPTLLGRAVEGVGGLEAGSRHRVTQHRSAVAETPVLRQNSVRRQVIDLAGPIQRQFRLDGHPPAPPASTASPPLRRSPPCRPGKPGLAPPARRL